MTFKTNFISFEQFVWNVSNIRIVSYMVHHLDLLYPTIIDFKQKSCIKVKIWDSSFFVVLFSLRSVDLHCTHLFVLS